MKSPDNNDIKLIISIEKEIYPKSTEFINVSIILENIANEQIYIYKSYSLLIRETIITPENVTLEIKNIVDISNDRIVLKQNKKIEYNLNLKSRSYWLNNKRFDWNISGEYSIYFEYSDENANFISNTVNFIINENLK